MHAVAVALAGFDVGQIAVPDLVGVFRKIHPHFGALFVEQAQLHARGMRGKQRKIGALAIEDGTARKRASLTDAGGVGVSRACWTSH